MGMDDTAAGGRAMRLFAVLAILVGLLAMHGVASAHHAAAATPAAGHSVLPAASSPTDEPTGPQHHHGTPVAQTTAMIPPDGALLAAPAGPACQDDCPGVVAICLTVQTGVPLALLLAERRACPVLTALVPLPARASSPPVRQARGPDPVRELCISRT